MNFFQLSSVYRAEVLIAESLKKVRKGPYIPLVIGFSGKGEPSYAKFGAPDSYDMWIHRLPTNMSTKGATFAIPCSKKSGKKETYGVLFMDFL